MVSAGGFVIVVLFQLTIVLGAPVGPAAWGGGHSGQLPPDLRLASVFSALFWSAAAMTVLSRGGVARSAIPPRAAGIGTWALVVILAVGTLTNIASRSNWERYGWAPLVLALTLVCFKLARTPAPGEAAFREPP
jgi:hypothetical protein